MLDTNPKTRIRAQQALNHKLFKECMDVESTDQLVLGPSQQNQLQQGSINNANEMINEGTTYGSFKNSVHSSAVKGVPSDNQSFSVQSPPQSPSASSQYSPISISLAKKNTNNLKENLMLVTPRRSTQVNKEQNQEFKKNRETIGSGSSQNQKLNKDLANNA